MCGRYGRRADKQRIAECMQTHNTNVFDDSYLVPSYNVAPRSFQPVVRLNKRGARELALMRWGLVPFWSKDGKAGFSTINAKAETIATSAMFREALKRRRCLVPADLFYEWKKEVEKTKQPYAIGQHFCFCRLMGDMEGQGDRRRPGNLHNYHHRPERDHGTDTQSDARYPPAKDYGRWLDSDPAQPPIDLLRLFPAEEMEAWKVSPRVGNVHNNAPDMCEEGWE